MSKHDSKIVSMKNDDYGNLVIDIKTRIVLDEHIASKLKAGKEGEPERKESEDLLPAAECSNENESLPKENEALAGKEATTERQATTTEAIDSTFKSEESGSKDTVWGVLAFLYLLTMILSMIAIVLVCFCGELRD